MDIKTFYFLSLSSISFFCGLLLWVIWQKSKEETPEKDQRGILFLSLTQFSWVALGLYTLLSASSSNNSIVVTTVNGIMSSLNNIFLVICIAYFQGFDGIKKRFPVLKDKEKWIFNTFITFVIVLMVILILDNIKIGNSLVGKYLVTILSISISIFTAIFCYYGIGASFQNSKYAKPLFFISLFVGAMLITTQVGFGYRNWIKIGNPQSENPYRDIMRFLFLISISWTSFLNLFLGKHWADTAEKEHLLAKKTIFSQKESEIKPPISPINQKIIPQSLHIIHDPKNKSYLIRLEALTSENKEPIFLEKSAEKLFLPFVYWLYFAIAKKKNILIRHEDIQVWKNRMGTYLNEKNEYVLDAFLADGGKYELNIEAAEIFFEGLDALKEKQSVKDIFTNFLLDTDGIDVTKFQKDKLYRLKMWEDVYAKQWENC